METMVRERWTDERLDDLNKTVDDGFEQVDKRFDKVDQRFDRLEAKVLTREEADQRFAEIDKRLDRMDARFKAMQSMMERRFDTLQYSILYSIVGMFAAVMAGFVALILAG
jgi:tetrahydromethanopterin S-methyltransferase subunit G